MKEQAEGVGENVENCPQLKAAVVQRGKVGKGKIAEM